MKDPTSQYPISLSRRNWLQRVSAPAMFTAGASLLGVASFASTQQPSSTSPFPGWRSILDYGARGDGKTNNTAAIQHAIDDCHNNNGGVVLIPAGDFLCGTIELKSNVTLYLAVNCRLLGSPRREDYQAPDTIPPGNGNVVFIFAANAENVAITGSGTIDGDGIHFNTGKGDGTGPGGQKGGNMDRPHLAIFYRCNNVRVTDTFFTRSAYHCFRILECRYVHFTGIRIYNRVNRNNDGFHFNSSAHVRISDCDVACQDDACALFGSNQFVTVTNCSFSTRWSIFRFGGGEAKNITVTNCVIYDTYGCPVKISAGKAKIENLLFSNIVMENVTGPIGIGFRAGAATDAYVRNISFSHIRASVVALPVNHPDIPFDVKPFDGEQLSCITLNGADGSYLENISFTDVHVTYAGGGSADLAGKTDIPQVAVEYFVVWGRPPFGPVAYGMYARNVKGLTLKDIRFTYRENDLRPAVVFDNVEDADVGGISIQSNTASMAAFRIINSRDVLITGARLLGPATNFLRVEGRQSRNITVDGGDLSKAVQPMVTADGAATDAIKFRS
ncbi:MAG TPA: glycosyl hydrolase family 28 protein [Chitinophaga sp.]|uniref:glycoside hydrolase family 28 protein n=1 Tax=Chitinophaga sp. TaxID=1869181 RepID=UPI002CE73935|nr:glycosyl hydrolase family 28 protein [Chitinophaga sp.]HVI49538.1 glycosyl hydrolase family 28 protein [Chitinophaga sp.]